MLQYDGIGDLEIRPCTPPVGLSHTYNFPFGCRPRALSTLTEKDEHENRVQIKTSVRHVPRVSIDLRYRGTSYLVFRDRDATLLELPLSDLQEKLLCEQSDKENSVRFAICLLCILLYASNFLSNPLESM